MKSKILVYICLTSLLMGADVIIKTSGNTGVNDGLSVQNSDRNELLKVKSTGDVQALKGRISDKNGLLSPVGSVTMFAASTAPNGWLICDGREISRTTYADLYSIIGDTYGSGDGSSTFDLPDLRGKGVKGYKSDNAKFDSIAKTGGEEEHTLTINEMPAHNHTGNTSHSGSHTHTFSVTTDKGGNGNGNIVTDDGSRGTKSISGGAHSHSFTTNPNGGNAAHNILDPYITMNYIIKY